MIDYLNSSLTGHVEVEPNWANLCEGVMSRVLEGVLKEFSKIAAIPRPSGQELRVAQYLCGRLRRLGAEVEIDRVGNVIGEVAATAGYEEKPLVALQAHMDMVCVADGSVKYNPLSDGIKLRRGEEYLEAEGTSLGADDGIGIAIILYALQKIKAHGPWRVIFTVDEEAGMTGARGLDPRHLKDVKYLINVDSENAEEIVKGSAGSVRIEFVHKLEWETVPPALSKKEAEASEQAEPEIEAESEDKIECYSIRVQGLKGGHSGEAIDRLHANAIKVLGEVLWQLDCGISAVTGGSALNVIPSKAQALVAISAQTLQEKPLKELLERLEETFREKYNESNLSITARRVIPLKRLMRKQDAKAIVTLLKGLKSGVFDDKEGVLTSANLGLVKCTDTAVYVGYMPRFHSIAGFNKVSKHATDVYTKSGFDEMNMSNFSREWSSKSDELVDLMLEVARKSGRELKKCVIHGGLECSHFIEMNPKLQIVSVGTTNLDIHSPNERLLLSSVEPTVTLIIETLKQLTGRKKSKK